MSKMKEKIEFNDRGLAQYGEFIDTYNNEVRVYESSNVKGGIWLRITDMKDYQQPHLTKPPNFVKHKSSHLSIKQTKHLIKLLKTAIKHQKSDDWK